MTKDRSFHASTELAIRESKEDRNSLIVVVTLEGESVADLSDLAVLRVTLATVEKYLEREMSLNPDLEVDIENIATVQKDNSKLS